MDAEGPVAVPGEVDPGSGRLVYAVVDVRLPGVLPLVVERRYRGGPGPGRRFGRAWVSTLDQRLLLGADGVRLVAADGRVVAYPVPAPGAAVLPAGEEGPHWPLSWDGRPGSPLTVTLPAEEGEAEGGAPPRTLTFAPVPGRPGSELPLTAVTDLNGNAIRLAHAPDGALTELVHSCGYRIAVRSDEAGRVTALALLGGPGGPLQHGPLPLARYRYDAAGNLAVAEDAAGNAEHLAYDARRRLTAWTARGGAGRLRYAYDEAGRVVRVTGTDGFLDRTLAYEEGGRIARVTDSLGHTTVYEHDERGLPLAVTDPLGHTWRREWDHAGRLLTRTDPLGRTTRWARDERGNATAVTYPDGATATAEFDDLGLPTTRTAEDGARHRYTYDERGNLLTEQDPTGAVTTWAYDARGARTAVTDALGTLRRLDPDPAGLPLAGTDEAGAPVRYERDALGRVVRVLRPDGTALALTWTPTGLPAARGAERRRYDAAGRLVEYVDAAGRRERWETGPFGVRVARNDGLRLEWDTELRLTGATDGAGRRWSWTWDPAGRLAEESGPTGEPTTHRWDAAGRHSGFTNAAGQRVSRSFDARGRVVEERTETDVTRFEYDAAGRLVEAANGETSLTRELDARGAVLSETCNGRTLRLRYDALGRPVERRTPGGTVTGWEYDAAGRPTALRAGNRRYEFTRDAAGRETERRLGVVVLLRQVWDAAGRPVQLVLPSGRRRAYAYREDGAGGTAVAVTAADGAAAEATVIQAACDAAGRLVAARAPGEAEARGFRYDAAGNALGVGLRYKGTLPAEGPGGAAWRHDAAGRVVSVSGAGPGAAGWGFTYDAHDRLTDVVTPQGQHWHYVYDALGRRAAKRLLDDFGAAVEETIWVWEGERPAEVIAPGGAATSWHWAPGAEVPLARTDPGSEGTCAVVADPTGVPTELLDAKGGVAWRGPAPFLGAVPGPVADPERRVPALPGHLADPETGLLYGFGAGHRAFDPVHARYLTPARGPAPGAGPGLVGGVLPRPGTSPYGYPPPRS
ncbi:DUF6531 domain-containing protein [Streptomyces sp. DSM 44917]|uniref:DUF6531 domain-containing protein n=1 Tax=Streptomyces boetiae TaxID=3075541 RepID=A0ABU2LAQ7_9ACTN|nr:DUF6531 domain-containing protein [Streptomyces sp. DSM 44917]MDT0308650.1 DUF6531 domain-containing protein [Streptomyces sp. DSM 44917]